MNAIGYIRVSTDGQVGEDKFGMDAQREQIMAYCAKNDITIKHWVIDEGESGAKERPGFDEIIYGDVGNPPYDAVVVAKSDRVARDINVYYYYKMMLKKKDMKLISIAEDFGQFGVFANMLEAFTLCVAEMERENITKRTAGGRKVKAARGGYSGGKPPYGYCAQNRKLVVVPDEANVVRFIIESKESGMTYKWICDELNAQGKTNRSGTKFSISTLQVIIDNKPLYQGMYRYGKDSEWVRGEHEAILSNGSEGLK